MKRRVGALLVALAVAGCGRPAAAPATPAVAKLHLEPITDLAPAAGLRWLVALKPRELAANPALIPAIDRLVTSKRFATFAERNGVDIRAVGELVLAGYPETTLTLARATLDPAKVEAAWSGRMVHVDGRSLDRATTDPLANIVRSWGSVGTEREQIAIFGREAVGLELGRFGPLRAAELFAEGRLKRASPALRADPLLRTTALVGDAPVRAFAPGPFTGDLAAGLGGLLGAATAVAGAARVVEPVATGAGGHTGLAFTVLLTGAWGADAPVAADRLRAAFDVLAATSVGLLLGLSHPLAAARVSSTADMLELEVTLDAEALADGLRAATAATVEEIMER